MAGLAPTTCLPKTHATAVLKKTVGGRATILEVSWMSGFVDLLAFL